MVKYIVAVLLVVAGAVGNIHGGEVKTDIRGTVPLTAEYDRAANRIEWPAVSTNRRGQLGTNGNCSRTSCDPFWHCYPSEFSCRQYNVALNCEDGIEIHGACFCQDC